MTKWKFLNICKKYKFKIIYGCFKMVEGVKKLSQIMMAHLWWPKSFRKTSLIKTWNSLFKILVTDRESTVLSINFTSTRLNKRKVYKNIVNYWLLCFIEPINLINIDTCTLKLYLMVFHDVICVSIALPWYFIYVNTSTCVLQYYR